MPRSLQNEISSCWQRGGISKEPQGEILPNRVRILVNRSLWEAFWMGVANNEISVPWEVLVDAWARFGQNVSDPW